MIALSPSLALLQDRIRKAASYVRLFPVVRRLESELATMAGGEADAEDERILFSHPPTYTLPASEILDVTFSAERKGIAAKVTTSLLGLLGAESPLPAAMGEEVLFDDEDTLQVFYDVFQGRALGLLYRSWKRSTPTGALDRSRDDASSRALLSLVGEDAFSTYAQRTPVRVDPVFSLGLSDVARCEPAFLDAIAFEQLLRRFFPDLNARVVPAASRLVRAADEDRTCLGTQHSTMGIDASYGSAALDASGLVRIRVGPVSRDDYEKLLPGGALYEQMQPMVETWLASRAIAELEVLLSMDDAPATRLGEEYGGTLGVDAHYRAPNAQVVSVWIPVASDVSAPTEVYNDTALGSAANGVTSEPDDGLPTSVSSETIWRGASGLLDACVLPASTRGVLDQAARVAATGRVDIALDLVIRGLDEAIAAQVDAVIHHANFQALEARWRGLAYLTSQVPSQENIELAILSCSKDDLAADLEEASEINRSRIYAVAYSAELGTFGGKPYGALLADMEFDASPRDVSLLGRLSAVATIAHAPFFAAAAPGLLRLASWRDLPRVGSVRSVFDAPSRLGWSNLRDAEDSRSLGLLVGRPLYRVPHGHDSSERFAYLETISAGGDGLLFGSPVYVLANRLAASFARYGTLAALVGDDEDACRAPASCPFPSLGPRYRGPPLEVTISPRLEHELRDAGLIGLMHRADGHVFAASANSLQRPRRFGTSDGGDDATLSHLLGTKFPYFLVACRFASYVKVLEREMAGAHRSVGEIEHDLNEWLSRYVQTNGGSAATRARYPLRDGRVVVTEVEGSPGWHRGEIQIRPHLRYLDHFVTLSVRNWVRETAGADPPIEIS